MLSKEYAGRPNATKALGGSGWFWVEFESQREFNRTVDEGWPDDGGRAAVPLSMGSTSDMLSFQRRIKKTLVEQLFSPAFRKSGRHDSNMRLLRPKRSALARLSYAPMALKTFCLLQSDTRSDLRVRISSSGDCSGTSAAKPESSSRNSVGLLGFSFEKTKSGSFCLSLGLDLENSALIYGLSA